MISSLGVSVKTKRFIRSINLDWPLLISILILFTLSVIVIYSAKLDFSITKRQGLRLAIAYSIMLATAQLSPRLIKNWAYEFYVLSLLLIVLVLFVGDTSKGAQRWLDLGMFRFQPSELMKLAVPISIAKYLETCVFPPTIRYLIIPFLIITIPLILVALQPDLGTAVLIACSGAFVIYFAGISWKFILSLVALGIACTPVFWMALKDYQRSRLLTLLNPESDPLGSGYHIIQSKIAIGSGGLYGKGWLKGTQSHLEFLPERTTDFIFAVYGEEFGLIGIVLLLAVYMFMIVRGLYISIQARDTFNRLIAGSLTMSLFVYVFVNIGMVCGILPIVGVPLPLVSYGGSSLVTIMVSLGIIMSIQSHKTLVRK